MSITFAKLNSLKIITLTPILVLATLLSVSAFAKDLNESNSVTEPSPKESLITSTYKSDIESIRITLNAQQKSIQKLSNNLPSNEIAKLVDKIQSIEYSLNTIANKDDYFTYADWAAIAITCVAVLLTIVGLALAGFAFWGYKEIKDLTKCSAATEAKLVAEKTTTEMIHSIVKNELEKLINDGKLREPLQDAIDIILRKDSNDPEQKRAKELLDELDIDEQSIEQLDIDRKLL
ncbi:hypothetical protein [Shewanella algidipiscicola]|uniref:Uncharacterized protein n=1 Tax=Shewanella algidipiscicola TaxID=614070 RepID=A0ABQ4NT91_9GAMM|nr:hypothetical protein [Shewanella algidipiscicola]GIU02801.1 hypothetical protein TUM4630_35180 [Shewanella algidipiscicola]